MREPLPVIDGEAVAIGNKAHRYTRLHFPCVSAIDRLPIGSGWGLNGRFVAEKAANRGFPGFQCLRSFEKPVFRAFHMRVRERLCIGTNGGTKL